MNGKQFATCNQTIVDALGYGGTCSNDCGYANIEIEPGKTYLFRIVQPTYLLVLISDWSDDRQFRWLEYCRTQIANRPS